MKKSIFSKSMAWILSVVMIFGTAFSTATVFDVANLEVSAAEVYGDFDFSPYDETARTMILVAKK